MDDRIHIVFVVRCPFIGVGLVVEGCLGAPRAVLDVRPAPITFLLGVSLVLGGGVIITRLPLPIRMQLIFRAQRP